MPTLFRITLASTLLALASSVSADDFDAASYHDAQCVRCHDTGVYTRENRRVGSLPALEVQVARCDANLGTALFPEDLSSLVGHLNTSFYKFGN